VEGRVLSQGRVLTAVAPCLKTVGFVRQGDVVRRWQRCGRSRRPSRNYFVKVTFFRVIILMRDKHIGKNSCNPSYVHQSQRQVET